MKTIHEESGLKRLMSLWLLMFAVLLVGACGCSPGLDASYGRSRTASINGTSVLANLFRNRGHEVRTAVRLSNELFDWPDVIVRFAPAPGSPPLDEVEWYTNWLNTARDRRLIYVPRDYDAVHEYWSRALAQLPKYASERERERIRNARDKADGEDEPVQTKGKLVPIRDDWFLVNSDKPSTICKTLGGPWASGLDVSKVSLVRHETLRSKLKSVLLDGDGDPLVITWTRSNRSKVLVVASGVFLLNLPLTEPARHPLVEKTLDWAVGSQDARSGHSIDGSKRVAFVEGSYVLVARAGPPSVFNLLKVSPFGRVAAQFLALGLVASLAKSPRLGRARPEVTPGADRPVAHPEALGTLLERAGQPGEARSILETYRRWRGGPTNRSTSMSRGLTQTTANSS